MQYINAPNIILGIMKYLDPITLIMKYCIKIEKTTIKFLSPTQNECKSKKKWLAFETVLGY